MALTVRDVLALPEVAKGRPQVVAGHGGLDHPVRWVHISELPDIAELLDGGELILTTGIALPASAAELRHYVEELASAGVSGLVIELGRAFQHIPSSLSATADRRALPLIALEREIQFVSVTEAVHARIVSAQTEELRTADLIHRTFTELSLEGADATRIVQCAAQMVGRPVILENLAHQVVAYAEVGEPLDQVLMDWERWSRTVRTDRPTQFIGEPVRWLIARVGARDETWGRLVLVTDEDWATPRQTMALEQAAVALALNRLSERDEQTLERSAHGALINDILEFAYSSSAEIHLRARALGVPLTQRHLAGIVIRFPTAQRDDTLENEARRRERSELVARAVKQANLHALVGSVQSGDLTVLLSVPGMESTTAALEMLARRVHRFVSSSVLEREATIGVGSTVDSIEDIRRSFREAEQVADGAAFAGGGKLYYRLPDVRIRGLLHILRDDPRLQTFVERELGALLAADAERGGDLIDVLGAYLEQGRNKSAAANAMHLSRPAFYQRLRRIEHILGVDLESVESCLSLHVALISLQATRLSAARSPDAGR